MKQVFVDSGGFFALLVSQDDSHAAALDVFARAEVEHWAQMELASRIGSSQSRVAKMEAADPSVSLDLLIRTLLALGASSRDLARAIYHASLAEAG